VGSNESPFILEETQPFFSRVENQYGNVFGVGPRSFSLLLSGTAMSTCNNCVRTPNISKQIQYSKWHDVNTYCIPL
jgi:hypothetical protein